MKYLDSSQLRVFNILRDATDAKIEGYKWSLADVQQVLEYLTEINNLRSKIDFYEKTYNKPYVKAVFGG